MSAGRKKTPKRRLAEGLILDTNLLLVFVVGWYDPINVSRFSRTKDDYSIDDYYIIRDLFIQHENHVTTPHILTEVSNFLGKAEGPVKESYFTAFSDVISQLEEVFIPAKKVFSLSHRTAFGLTDLGILEVARQGHQVLTADSRLADYLSRQGIHAVDYKSIQ